MKKLLLILVLLGMGIYGQGYCMSLEKEIQVRGLHSNIVFGSQLIYDLVKYLYGCIKSIIRRIGSRYLCQVWYCTGISDHIDHLLHVILERP